MSGKKSDFRRLVEYIGQASKTKGDSSVLVRNMYVDGSDNEAIIEQFEKNSRYLPKRKNGNFLYHEIISLEANNRVKEKHQETALIDLVDQYLQRRAPGQLAYGKMHHDSDNLHFHLIISANQVRSRQRVRWSKKDFVAIQKSVENYKIEKYPQLGQRRRHHKNKSGHYQKARSQQREQEYTKRTQKTSHKERLRGVLTVIFDRVRSSQQLNTLLAEKELKIYQRGKNWGVQDINTGSKSRFKTLGIDGHFEQVLQRFEKLAERSLELSWRRERQGREHEMER